MTINRIVLLWIGLIMTSAVHADDWAHWRGPEHDGVSRERGLPADWSLDEGKNVLWKSDIGGRATPIVLNGRVYLDCRTEHSVTNPDELINAGEQVVCWDAATGEVLWKDKFNVFQTDIPAPRVGWASMAGDPETGNVFLHSVSGLFRCYSPDGKILWERLLGEEFGQISGYGGRIQTPIVDEDRVIISFMALGWGDTKAPPPLQRYYAFDKRTGELQWMSAPGTAPNDTNYSVPVVTVIDGVRMLIGGNCDGGIYAIQARTGETLWSLRMSKRSLNASPAVDGKYVYITHGEDNIDNLEFGRIQCIDATGRGDLTGTKYAVWRVDGIKAGYASPLVHDGILYVVSDTARLHAFDSQTGEPLWEHVLGTVGKGSPVWADGKLYVMEVNGNIHILKPSREKCESLSHVQLLARVGEGSDEIYASPAIADGRVYFVTRDRTICIGDKDHTAKSDPVPPLEPEKNVGDEVALLRLVPYESSLDAGESEEYELQSLDANGRVLKTTKPNLTVGTDLKGAKLETGKLTATANMSGDQAGPISAELNGKTAKAEVRMFPELPWKWDFEGYTGKQVPPTWVTAFLKLQPVEVDGSIVMRNAPGKGRPSVYIWIGPPEMSGYTVQADVMAREKRRRMSNVGITAQRYNLILKGNSGQLDVQSWAPHRRMAQEMSFPWDPDVWYTMKLRVDVVDGKGHVKGKVWQRDHEEPKDWTIEVVDPNPNTSGSPGLYAYSLSECFIDNVIVTKETE